MVYPKGNSSTTIAHTSASHRPLKVLPVTAGLVVLLVVVLVGPSFTQAKPLLSPNADKHTVEFKRYCSNNLSEIMFSICGGNFNSIFNRMIESDSESSRKTANMKRLAAGDDDYDLFFKSASLGPVHECCRRPCGYTELRQYCS